MPILSGVYLIRTMTVLDDGVQSLRVDADARRFTHERHRRAVEIAAQQMIDVALLSQRVLK
jgi:hypothetical protein